VKSINLLPWREAFRSQQKKQFFKTLMMLGFLGLFCVFIFHLFVDGAIKKQQDNNYILQNTIAKAELTQKKVNELKKQKQQVILNLQKIEQIQHQRYWIVRFVNELPKMLPPNVYLNRLTREGNKVFLEGKTESNSSVSLLIRNIKKSECLIKPKLKEIKTNSKQGEWHDFSLQSQVR
jgi:type IV pilus assembly protein PilN